MKKFFRRLSTKRGVIQDHNRYRSPNKQNWASVSSNSLPASCTNPTFQKFPQSNPQAAPQHDTLTVQQDPDQTEAGSSASFHTLAPDRQATPPPPKQPQIMQADTPALQLPTGEAMPSGSAVSSATNIPSPVNLAHISAQHSRSSSQPHEPASIYKSYSDLHDIMSSGTFDFSQHHLLSSAPDGDWLSMTEDQPSDRLPDRPKTATEARQPPSNHPWETQPSDRPPPPPQPPSKRNKVKRSIPRNPAFSSPDACAKPRSLPPYSGPSPMAAMQAHDHSSTRPMVTPFAKYSNSAMSGPLMSTDLDSAMRANGQNPPVPPLQKLSSDRQRSGKQYTLLDL
ncbi:hypothetical protein ABBQ32_009769 [Trebouxia sp. C0010 RCD-2024]